MSSHWPYPGPINDSAKDNGSAAVNSSLNVSRSFSGGTASGSGSITGSNGTSGLEVNLHAQSQVNGGLAGADWELLNQSAGTYNFHFEPGNLIGMTNPANPLYLTLVADYSITSSRDCTPPHCYSGGSLDLQYFQYGSWGPGTWYSTASPVSLVSIPGADSAGNTEELSILLAPFYEPGGNLTTYTGINVSAEVRATAQYPGGPAGPPSPSVPEPSTFALTAMGLLGIGIARRWRRV